MIKVMCLNISLCCLLLVRFTIEQSSQAVFVIGRIPASCDNAKNEYYSNPLSNI